LEKESSPAFLVDGMLGTSARKLRVLGFDTVYDTESADKDLIQKTLSTRRTLLTSDVDLYLNAKCQRADAILVKGLKEEDRLYEILTKSGVLGINIDSLTSRCSVCNGELLETGTQGLRIGKVYSCSSCGKRYWRGGHWKKMGPLFERVNSRLRNPSAGRISEVQEIHDRT
jgi:uncharacterized protein